MNERQITIPLMIINLNITSRDALGLLERYLLVSLRKMQKEDISYYLRMLNGDIGNMIGQDSITMSTRHGLGIGSVLALILATMSLNHANTLLEQYYMRKDSIKILPR